MWRLLGRQLRLAGCLALVIEGCGGDPYWSTRVRNDSNAPVFILAGLDSQGDMYEALPGSQVFTAGGSGNGDERPVMVFDERCRVIGATTMTSNDLEIHVHADGSIEYIRGQGGFAEGFSSDARRTTNCEREG